MFEDHDHTRVA